MTRVDQVPYSGSCARCQASLGLASVEREDTWYCSTACAEGHPEGGRPAPRVPEPWLYTRPRRFFGRRRPIELGGK